MIRKFKMDDGSMDLGEAAKVINRTVDPRQYLTKARGGRFDCPFCGKHHTPSMEYNSDKNLMNCFACEPDPGQQVKMYSVIDIYMQTQHTDFVQAVKDLAPQAGVKIEDWSKGGSFGWNDEVDERVGNYDLHNIELDDSDASASAEDESKAPAPTDSAQKPESKPAVPDVSPSEKIWMPAKEPDKFTVSVVMDAVGYTQKPANIWEVRAREKVPTQDAEKYQLPSFAHEVTSGHTFYPFIFRKTDTGEKRNGKPVYFYQPIAQQIFVVDIDNEEQYKDDAGKIHIRGIADPLTIPEAKEICQANGVYPFLIYETFSSKQHRDAPQNPYKKFRLCFAVTEVLKVLEVGQNPPEGKTAEEYGAEILQKVTKYLISMFGKAADQKVTDVSRMIFGTDEKNAEKYNAILDGKKLTARVLAGVAPVMTYDKLKRQKSGEADIDDFFNIASSHRYEAVPTGIPALDRRLSGGFVNEWLVIITAAPGAGKTVLATQICENMARAGHKCVYFNFEMSKDQLIARSLARMIDVKYDIGALDIMRLYKMGDAMRNVVFQAGLAYKQQLARNMSYNPAGIGTELPKVLEAMESAAKAEEAEGRPAPICCIDYLQMLTVKDKKGQEKDAKDAIKDAVYGFKKYAEKHHTIVIAISAQSRSANNDVEARQDAGRDTSNIEYSADLQLQIMTDKEDEDVRQLYLTKSRFAAPSLKHHVDFLFEGKQGRFTYLKEDISDNAGKKSGNKWQGRR